MTQTARVAINGYGVIGKRVADAVALQDDMELVGVADVMHDYRIRVAVERGYPVHASTPESRAEMEAARIPVAGTLDDLLSRADVVVDCTPKKVGVQNRPRYAEAGVKSIWQGGEKHEVAGYSFVAQVNYEGAVGRDSARVVSCNTTALSRISHALHRHGWAHSGEPGGRGAGTQAGSRPKGDRGPAPVGRRAERGAGRAGAGGGVKRGFAHGRARSDEDYLPCRGPGDGPREGREFDRDGAQRVGARPGVRRRTEGPESQ